MSRVQQSLGSIEGHLVDRAPRDGATVDVIDARAPRFGVSFPTRCTSWYASSRATTYEPAGCCGAARTARRSSPSLEISNG